MIRPDARIGFFLPALGAGGIPRSMLQLAREVDRRGYRAELLLGRSEGIYELEVSGVSSSRKLEEAGLIAARALALRADPAGVGALLLPILLAPRPAMALRYLPALTRVLRDDPPDALVTAHEYANLVGLWARRLAGARLPVVVTLHADMSYVVQRSAQPQWRFLPGLMRRSYPWADAVVSVSEGAARDLERLARLPEGGVQAVYNAVVPLDLAELAARDPRHRWLAPGQPPVVLAAGRFKAPKDFFTLLRAFATLRRGREARLILLGRGFRQHEALEALAKELGIGEDVDFPGFANNPYAFMARSAAFVLSSQSEGFGNVLVEAMACGCPVVSTDCDFGPREILANGRHGALVPVGDEEAMATALGMALDSAPDRDALRARASEFSVERAADRYLELLDSVSNTSR